MVVWLTDEVGAPSRENSNKLQAPKHRHKILSILQSATAHAYCTLKTHHGRGSLGGPTRAVNPDGPARCVGAYRCLRKPKFGGNCGDEVLPRMNGCGPQALRTWQNTPLWCHFVQKEASVKVVAPHDATRLGMSR